MYLRTPADVCLERIEARGRSEETTIPGEYLKDLEVLHDEWLTDNPKAVMIDGTKQWTAREFYDVLREADVALATEEELIAAKT